MIRNLSSLIIFLVFISSPAFGQGASPQTAEGKKDIFAIVEVGEGKIFEGVLRPNGDTLRVRTQDNQEKTVTVRSVSSISLERIKSVAPIEDRSKEGYAVRLENSREIYTLAQKYSFSLKTNVGVVTKTIDPERVSNLLLKDAAKSEDGRSLLQDQSVVFKLELKF